MKHIKTLIILVILLAPVLAVDLARADTNKNIFASITLDGKKIGQVQYTVRHDDDGTLQELKTRASLSILGLEVYHNTLDTHELWEAGEMKRLWGNFDDNGTSYKLDLTRTPDDYVGTLNSKQIKLPPSSFPTAVWHYAITEHDQLFSVPELHLLQVTVKKSPDTILIGNKNIPAEKFVFSGDWNATVWFDNNKQFLKWQYKVKGKTIVVLLDA